MTGLPEDAITELTDAYRSGELDQYGYIFPYNIKDTSTDIPPANFQWFENDPDIHEGYSVDGFHSGGAPYEYSPLWYAILNCYPEFDEWSVEHGGLRFENWSATPDAIPHSRYEEILAEAREIFISILFRPRSKPSSKP